MKLYWGASRDIKSGWEDCFPGNAACTGITTGIYMHIDHGKCDVFHPNARREMFQKGQTAVTYLRNNF